MTDPPPPFNALNWSPLAGWKKRPDDVLGPFLNEVLDRVEADTPKAREYSLAPPVASGHVTEAHLALIHICHRSKWFDAKFDGAETYRWDLAVYGSKRTLDRIEHVIYYLHPAYERDAGNKPSTAVVNISAEQGRHNCFLVKQIANGHSLVRARIRIRDQVDPVSLSRYINLFHSRDKIDKYFV